MSDPECPLYCAGYSKIIQGAYKPNIEDTILNKEWLVGTFTDHGSGKSYHVKCDYLDFNGRCRKNGLKCPLWERTGPRDVSDVVELKTQDTEIIAVANILLSYGTFL